VTGNRSIPKAVSVRANLMTSIPAGSERNPTNFNLPVRVGDSVAAKDREGHDVVAFRIDQAKLSQ